MKDNIWTTKEGNEISISEMETSHIENAIKMLEKNAEAGTEIVVGAGYDGDDDFMTAEVEFVQGRNYLNYTQYDKLKAELEKRTLLEKR